MVGTKYNTLQVIRPVVETAALKRFLRVADYAARVATGNQNFVMIDRRDFLPSGVNDDMYDDDEPMQEVLGLAEHTNYASHTLRLSLLERRAPAGYRNNAIFAAYNMFSRVAARGSRARRKPLTPKSGMSDRELLQAALRRDVPSLEDNIELGFSGIVPVNSPGYDAKGIEMALVPDNRPELLLVHDEATIAFNALEKHNRSMAYFAQKSVPIVPFLRLPNDISNDAYEQFCGLVTHRLPIDLSLGPIETKFNN